MAVYYFTEIIYDVNQKYGLGQYSNEFNIRQPAHFCSVFKKALFKSTERCVRLGVRLQVGFSRTLVEILLYICMAYKNYISSSVTFKYTFTNIFLQHK